MSKWHLFSELATCFRIQYLVPQKQVKARISYKTKINSLSNDIDLSVFWRDSR
jgi:hypothetical protein